MIQNNRDLTNNKSLTTIKNQSFCYKNVQNSEPPQSLAASDLNSKNSSLESFLLLAKRKVSNFCLTLSDINLEKSLSVLELKNSSALNLDENKEHLPR